MTDADHVTTEDYVTAPEKAVRASKASVKFGQYMTPKGIYYTRNQQNGVQNQLTSTA